MAMLPPPHKKPCRTSRALIRVRVEFESGRSPEHIKGEGRSTDIATSGCSVESDHCLSKGIYLTLRIHLPGLAAPVHVILARVRWVQGSEFGVEFIQLRPQDQLRLSQLTQTALAHEAVSIPEAPFSPPNGSHTILVVDDDPDIRHLCALKLKRYGFTVLQASGSTEALQICSTHVGDIHLALVDVMLDPPVFQLRTEKLPYLRIHGHTLVNSLLEARKGLRAVLMSSHSKTTLEKNGLMIGELPFLQKPLFVETLLATIRQQVERLPLEEAS